MRRITSTSTSLVLALGLAATAGIAADVDPTTFVDCSAEDDATLVLEGEPLEETHTSAPLTYPEGEFSSLGAPDPTGGALRDQHQIRIPLAFNHVDGQRPTTTVTIQWDTVSDIDLDVLDADGEIVTDDHAFNIDSQDFTATGMFSPEPCETYTVVINNSYAVGNQAVTLTADVESKAPRRR